MSQKTYAKSARSKSRSKKRKTTKSSKKLPKVRTKNEKDQIDILKLHSALDL
jgi:hypothetical protein